MTQDENNLVIKIIHGKNHHHSILFLNAKELQHNLPPEVIAFCKELLLNPRHLIINCFICEYIPVTWIGLFQLLVQQLQDAHKKVIFIYLSEALKENCPEANLTQFQTCSRLQEAIQQTWESSGHTPPSMNFLRSFVNALTNTLFIQSNTPLIRQKPYKKKTPEELQFFQSEIAGVLLVRSKDFFYALSLSLAKSTYLKILSQMLGEEQIELTHENINGLAEIVSIVIGQVKKFLSSQYKFECSFPRTQLKRDVPKLEVTFHEKTYITYQEGESVVIPFESTQGALYLEIWTRKEFSSTLFK